MIEKQKSEQLQALLKENNIDTLVLTKFDPHQSEDSGDYYNFPKYFSGYTGSQAKIIITQKDLFILTDGRYYLQAEKETKENGYTLVKESELDSVPFLDYAINITKENGTIAFLADTLSLSVVNSFLPKLKNKNLTLKTDIDLIEKVWTDRAFTKTDKIFDLNVKYTGEDRLSKIAKIKNSLKEKNVKNYILSSLDDIAYTLNLRGFDIEYNTFFASYLIFEQDKTTLFVDLEKISDVKEILEKDGITILPYGQIFEYISTMKKGEKTLINENKTCYEIVSKGSHLDFILEKTDISEEMKAIKNAVEIENIKNSSNRDNASLVRSFKRIKENADKLTEVLVADILLEERKKDDLYLMESFHPICAYMSNAAMPHYHATKEEFSSLKAEGVILIDSGATYFDGTTDITRVITLGEVSDEIKVDYTLVLKSHFKVANAKFVSGTSGGKIDAIAREPMWNVGRNFNHGTGHGIAFVGPVHEGPHSLGFKDNGVMLKDNMIMSNEPGLYVLGSHGIRTENTVSVIPFMETIDGQFLQFETLSYLPYELELIKKEMLTSEEIEYLNEYHKQVYTKLSPYLSGDDLEFLKEQTKQI